MTPAEPVDELAQLDELDEPAFVEGLAIEPLGSSSGVRIAQASVVGGDGGTTAFTARVRIAGEDWSGLVEVPFATFRDAGGRSTSLGNLEGTVLRAVGDGLAIGAAVQLPVGRAYTWTNDGTTLWPQGGADLMALWARHGDTSVLTKFALGLHGSGGYEPFPGVFAVAEAAVAVDRALAPGVGVVAEASLAWWDTSPLDASALLRVDPSDGTRIRGGLLLPLASWAGLQPAPVPSGWREVTLLLDLTVQM